MGDLAGDPTGFAVAWTALGGISALLVWSTLRAAYPVGAVMGAAFGNHTIQPEGLATALVLIAVRLLNRGSPTHLVLVVLVELGAVRSCWRARRGLVARRWRCSGCRCSCCCSLRPGSRSRAIALTVVLAVLLTRYAVTLVGYTPNRALPGPQPRTAVATVP